MISTFFLSPIRVSSLDENSRHRFFTGNPQENPDIGDLWRKWGSRTYYTPSTFPSWRVYGVRHNLQPVLATPFFRWRSLEVSIIIASRSQFELSGKLLQHSIEKRKVRNSKMVSLLFSINEPGMGKFTCYVEGQLFDLVNNQLGHIDAVSLKAV